MWHVVDSIDRFGNGWIVRYSIPSCCHVFKSTVVIQQENKPTTKEIEDAINNKRK